MKTREDKRMVKLFFNFFFQNYPYWAYMKKKSKKNQHVWFLVHGHSSWSTFSLHLVRAPKALLIVFLRNRTMEFGL